MKDNILFILKLLLKIIGIIYILTWFLFFFFLFPLHFSSYQLDMEDSDIIGMFYIITMYY